jgi:hypothetical protein
VNYDGLETRGGIGRLCHLHAGRAAGHTVRRRPLSTQAARTRKGPHTRLVASSLLTAVVLASFATSACAQGTTKPRNHDKYDRYERYEDERDLRDAPFFRLFPGYQARNPDNFRYGSDAWWRAMDREGRGGYRP